MEYVVVRATHPTWLTLQLPTEVATLIRFEPPGGAEGRDAGRTISFLARGPGLVRVIATYPAREALAIETVRSRLLANARPGDRLLFTLPSPVAEHLGLKVYSRGPRLRGTDDTIVWFVPAPEYYEYRSITTAGRDWTGPTGGPFAHVYLAKSLVPFPKELAQLAETEFRIEQEEWRPGVEALHRIGRGRRAIL
ncbi:MAG TPA: hypothetical protein VML53_02235 [Thermoplasmata archaeon]|nr:hypothetical protein [Thermoplasmata archaeon]